MSFQDRREFEKYLKFLTAKVLQTVVQSRQGRKIQSKSDASGNDWFNVSIPDDKQVTMELKRSLEGRLPEHDQPVCIEIQVANPDNDSLVLEVWLISLDNSSRDVSVSISHLLYPRMSLMLKSVIAISRTTPAYRYSRRTEDDNTFTFRVYSGSPDIPNYLQDFKRVKFASSSCLFGTISISLGYRTAISATRERSTTNLYVLNRQISSPLDEHRTMHSLNMPFASNVPPNTSPNSQEGHPFSVFLPSEIVDRQESGGTDAGGDEVIITHCDSSPSEPQGFLLVDLEGIKPAFVSEPSTDDLSEFLQQCKEQPDLDMFTGGDSMDVAAALKLADSHSVDCQ